MSDEYTDSSAEGDYGPETDEDIANDTYYGEENDNSSADSSDTRWGSLGDDWYSDDDDDDDYWDDEPEVGGATELIDWDAEPENPVAEDVASVGIAATTNIVDGLGDPDEQRAERLARGELNRIISVLVDTACELQGVDTDTDAAFVRNVLEEHVPEAVVKNVGDENLRVLRWTGWASTVLPERSDAGTLAEYLAENGSALIDAQEKLDRANDAEPETPAEEDVAQETAVDAEAIHETFREAFGNLSDDELGQVIVESHGQLREDLAVDAESDD